MKVGIIGCGKITEVRHAPEYSENPHCEIVAWYDAIPARALAMAEKFGGQVYASVDELLQSGVDAVSVCVANNAHADVTIRALDAGCHVLCEKPMAVTAQECELMLEASKRNGKRLLLGHNQRFAAAHIKAREMINAGEIGHVLAFHTTFAHPGPEGWTGQKNSWFFDRSSASFGALGDLGIHKTDLIHYLLNEPIVRVTAMMGTLDKRYPDGSLIAVDDNAFCIYQTKSGAIGQMHAGWTNYASENNSTQIYGTKGVLHLYEDPEYSLVMERRDGEKIKLQLDELTTNEDQTIGNRINTGVIDHFVEAVISQKPSVIDADVAIWAMRVVFAAWESALSGKTMDIHHS